MNPDVPASWLAIDLALAVGALLLRGGYVLAGGLLANALVSQLCGGVPDFIPIAGRLLSPGDVAIVLGFVPVLYRYTYSKPVSDDSSLPKVTSPKSVVPWFEGDMPTNVSTLEAPPRYFR